MDSIVLTMEAKDQRQTDGDLRRSHRQDEEKHDLTIGLPPSRAGRDKRYSRAVQHEFDGHQNEEQVTAHEETGQPQRE